MPFCIQCRTSLPLEARVCPSCRALQPSADKLVIGPGTTFDLGYGRVVFDQRVGEGGMGVVWRGWLFHAPQGPRGNEPPEPVALKVLKPQAKVKLDARALFVNEADTLRRLSHPNVVRYYDLFEWTTQDAAAASSGTSERASLPAHSVQGSGPRSSTPLSSLRENAQLVLAIEYVVGDTLEDVIARHVARASLAGGAAGGLPCMPFRRAFYYFEQLLGALAATHALGVVHRDVKPSNVLVRQDGIVKLGDFGIARLCAPPPGGGPPTAQTTGFAAGTGAYMSPEQVLSRPLDGRSDLYAAGIVLYEMLSGRTPFEQEDDTEFMLRKRQVESQVPPIRTWLAQPPPALDALFARALAKDPAQRFASAIEMGNAFRAGFGFPESPEWQAQAAFAREASPQVRVDAAQQKRMATLREFVVQGYRTVKLEERPR